MSGSYYQPTVINIFSGSPGEFAPAIGLFSPAYTAGAGTFTGIDPGLIAASYLGFQQAENANLDAVTNQGGAYVGAVSYEYGQWANYQNDFLQTVGNAFADAEHKSAKACGGFLSCIFG